MTFYVCKQCNYKHTFLPLACVRCKGTNFYPLITGNIENPKEVITDNTKTLYNALEKLDKAKIIIKEMQKALDGRCGFDEDIVFRQAENFLEELEN